MRLSREQFIHAAAFLKPAILMTEETNGAAYVHVKVDGEKCTMTTTNHYCGKRVVLMRPQAPMDMEKAIEDMRPPEGMKMTITSGNRTVEIDPHNCEFLISKPVFAAFETLCQKHKAKLADRVKRDITLGFIDILPKKLESHTSFIENPPAHADFPDVNMHFEMQKEPISELYALPDSIACAVKGLDKFAKTEISLSRDLVFIEQYSGAYQAWFLTENSDD